jgi:exodeoxyribonuclease V alpha subunit
MSAPTQAEELLAQFQHFTFRAEDDALCIARVRLPDGTPRTVKGSPDAGPRLQNGGTYRFHGRWEEHDRFGRQFAFVSFSAVATGDRNGVIAYLISVAENVGEKRAAALWDRYGPLAVTVLRENPEQVTAAGIMSVEQATEAAESLRREVAFEAVRIELLGLLSGRGFQLSRLIREVLQRLGRQAAQLIRENPYRLLLGGYPSCGWKRCDRLYLDLGHDAAAMERQALCAVYHLREQADGSTWLPAEQVGAAVAAAIGERADPTAALIMARDELGLLVTRRDAADRVWVAEAINAGEEEIVARRIKEVMTWQPSKTQTGEGSSPTFLTLWPDAALPTSESTEES